ncbi:Gfo/Idh/MocA family protein [Dactylosporangium matsuzakiense]|uniref:Dehydrogenase n=1 Tax=Dactylosporangium matsuzakiense TaxID=53360 RepID=A0A9W6NLU7_9ACTN|nr:Gfo/Idh/MocA family oxidoreductase [Dactylosporangium matsuzakiense]UWZ41594.1 Gfo/Idh/MocA family oxidoreductase [Dactylosporangium matsuzakiense]GLL02335.1 dehydrogenase [Dactylosporangium matsuzakiense]
MSTLPTARTADPADAPPIRWGIIAPGWIAGQFAGAVHKHSASTVVAVGSRSQERAEQFAAQYGARAYGSYEALVADDGVDAVYVASPHSHHAEQTRLALEAGKPVLVEKAFTQNAAQAAGLVELAAGSGLLLMEAMWSRFLPHYDIVRQLLADGALGEIQTTSGDHGQYFDIPPTHRLLNPDLAGGALLDLGIYPISFTSFVLGAPDEIRATATMAATGVDAQVSAVLRTGAAHGIVSTTQTAKTPTTAAVAGTEARVEIPGDFYSPQAVRLTTRTGETQESAAPAIRGHDGLVYQAAHFAELLRAGATESPLLPLAETVSIMETMDEIRRQIGLVYPDERGEH